LNEKKLKKKLKKNITSEAINKIKPKVIPKRTLEVKWPPNVDSIITSYHHENNDQIKKNKDNKKIELALGYK